MVIKGDKTISDSVIASIKNEIDDSNFPYLVDLQNYETIKNFALIDLINRLGKIIFSLMNEINNNKVLRGELVYKILFGSVKI